VLGVVPLPRAEGSEEESQVGLVVPEDVRPSPLSVVEEIPLEEIPVIGAYFLY